MKKLIKPTLLFLILIALAWQSCTNQPQESTAIETELAPEVNTEKTNLKLFESSLRPNKKIELAKVYTDTVKYLEFNDDGDYSLFLTKKNNNNISLICTDEYNFIKGEEIEIKWKMDSIRFAGDPEFLNFKEFLVSVKKIKNIELVKKAVNFLWRENLYNEEFDTDISTIVMNDEYIKNISEPERAALAYAATFIGNECEWDGKANEERSNLKCKILSALSLGYQCSSKHLDFLRYWFRNNETILDELENCPTLPDGATIQNTFDEINIDVNDNEISVFFKASGYNMRESESWNWTEKYYFEFNEDELILIKKDIAPKEHHTFENSEN